MITHSTKKGFSFGITSAVITTLGLMVGLESGTASTNIVLGGILTIAFADAFSDALGIHVSEEAENQHTQREIWQATLVTFFTKALIGLSFAVPVLLFPLSTAILVAGAWGLLLLAGYSYYIGRGEGAKPWSVIGEHLLIAVVVILVSHQIGHWVKDYVGS